MRIISIMMPDRLTRGRRREEEEEEEQEKKKQQQRHANCTRDNWARSRDFWGRRFRNLVGELLCYMLSLSLLRDRDATYLRIWQGSADGNSLCLLGTTNGLNDLGLGSLVGPMGTFPLDTFEKYPWEPPGPST